MGPEITWILPVKNGLPHLRQTLDSIAGQTYKKHRVIAWDNGSTDGSVDELRRWIPERVPGVVISDWPVPLGDCTAIMVGMAQTELIAHTDHDDVSLPHRLETQVEFLAKHPEVGFLGSVVEHIDAEGRKLDRWQPPLGDGELRWRARWFSPFIHSSMMMRRNAVLAAGNFRVTPGIAWDDGDMWIRGSMVAEFRNLQTPVVKYRWHSRQTTHGITDYRSTARTFAKANESILFPGIPAGPAMELWESSFPDDDSRDVRFRNLTALRRAAAGLARATGRPADYYTRNPFYRDQMYWLRQRFLSQGVFSGPMRWYHSVSGERPDPKP